MLRNTELNYVSWEIKAGYWEEVTMKLSLEYVCTDTQLPRIFMRQLISENRLVRLYQELKFVISRANKPYRIRKYVCLR